MENTKHGNGKYTLGKRWVSQFRPIQKQTADDELANLSSLLPRGPTSRSRSQQSSLTRQDQTIWRSGTIRTKSNQRGQADCSQTKVWSHRLLEQKIVNWSRSELQTFIRAWSCAQLQENGSKEMATERTCRTRRWRLWFCFAIHMRSWMENRDKYGFVSKQGPWWAHLNANLMLLTNWESECQFTSSFWKVS